MLQGVYSAIFHPKSEPIVIASVVGQHYVKTVEKFQVFNDLQSMTHEPFVLRLFY